MRLGNNAGIPLAAPSKKDIDSFMSRVTKVLLLRGMHKEFGVSISILAEWAAIDYAHMVNILNKKLWRHI